MQFRNQMAPNIALPQFLLRVRIMVRGFRLVIPNLQRIDDVLAAKLRWIVVEFTRTSRGCLVHGSLPDSGTFDKGRDDNGRSNLSKLSPAFGESGWLQNLVA